MKSILDAILPIAAILLLIGLIGSLAPYDDTDPPGGRSGLRLFTDARTGCQYLQGGIFGGTTPRLDEDGKPMCGVKK